MASGGSMQFSSLDEQLEYNNKLYKEILNSFTSAVHAIELRDEPCISTLLTVEQMQKVQRKQDNDGPKAAARELLGFLQPKPGFFDAILTACENPDLKLEHCILDFKRKRDHVNNEWRKQKGQQINRDTDQQGNQNTFPVPLRDSGGVRSDFTLGQPLRTPQQAQDQSAGLQVDTELETEEDTAANAPLAVRNISTSEFEGQSSNEGGAAAGAADDPYTDATSRSTYASLNVSNPAPDDDAYTRLITQGVQNSSLQVDATPMPENPSDAPEVAVAEPEVPGAVLRPQARPRPQTRQEHPSLRAAISNNPLKDFEAELVMRELSALPGWCRSQEEHEVIQLIRPHRQTEGKYVIWYWALAKRPTICVVLNRRVITFVVHKSSRSNPAQYFINKRQKRDPSLQALVRFHVLNGIRYKPDRAEEISVMLSSPIR